MTVTVVHVPPWVLRADVRQKKRRMRIQDIQSAEAELSFHWRLLPVSAKQKRSFVIAFLEAVEVAHNPDELRTEFMRRARERVNPVIFFMFAQLVFELLKLWLANRDPNA